MSDSHAKHTSIQMLAKAKLSVGIGYIGIIFKNEYFPCYFSSCFSFLVIDGGGGNLGKKNCSQVLS